jgi:predicted branched-subunit amino acid permease
MPIIAASEFAAGVRAELPILLGVAPFGMIYGALAIAEGLPAPMAQAMSVIVFAGSAQFVAVQLIGGGAPAMVLLLTTFVVNVRHMLYSASIAPYVRPLRPAWKWLLAYLLTDEAYAIAIVHYQRTDPTVRNDPEELGPSARDALALSDREGGLAALPDPRHWYLLGAGLALWTTWQISTAAGILVGARMPPGWSLEFALPLTFIALLTPILRDRPAIAAAVAAGLVAIIGAGWPYKLGLVAAAMAGIVAGAWTDRHGIGGGRPR